jgi:hypothetical protein
MALTPDEIRALPDLYERIRQARDAMDEHLEAIGELARIRRTAAATLVNQGVPLKDIAENLGLSYEGARKLTL